MERTWRSDSLGPSCDSLILPVWKKKAIRCEVRELMIRSLGNNNVVDSIMSEIGCRVERLMCKNEPRSLVRLR